MLDILYTSFGDVIYYKFDGSHCVWKRNWLLSWSYATCSIIFFFMV